MLLPLVTLGVVNAIIRFGLDREIDKRMFSGAAHNFAGLPDIGCGGTLCRTVYGAGSVAAGYSEDMFVQNIILIDAFVLMSSMRSLCSQFIRARGLVRLFAVDGILSTATTIFFTVLFLVWLQMGVAGYILATICADFLSVIFLFTTGRLHRFLKLRGISRGVSGRMLRYCVPLIPNTICWWITNTSSRYMVVAFLGSSYNG
ncbi:MAG: lipopolysaccharide biosynthesis protein, partial [[Clostridium] leptum]